MLSEGEVSLLSWEPTVEWQGRECRRLINRGLGSEEVFHYFDTENGLEICREVTMFIGGASRTFCYIIPNQWRRAIHYHLVLSCGWTGVC